MSNYEVLHFGDKWKVIGPKRQAVFNTKYKAIIAGRRIARSENSPLIIRSRAGDVTSVNFYNRRVGSSRIMTANVKHNLDHIIVRNSIAEVLLERQRGKKIY